MTEPSAPRILIIKTGTTNPATRRRFGDYDRWFVDALRGVAARFTVHDITRSSAPTLAPYLGMIITGSPAGVYERASWMGDLAALLREVAERQAPPALCVCFGAQALAESLGGRVTPNPLGWEIGTIRVRRTDAGREDALLGGEAEELTVQATHQDWIEALPGGAVVLAENGMSPFQAFRLGEQVWGTQFHPEATPAILEELLRSRRDSLVEEKGARGYRSLLDRLSLAPAGRQLLARFVRRAASS